MNNQNELTDIDKRILSYIYVKEDYVVISELATALGYSRSMVVHHVRYLEERKLAILRKKDGYDKIVITSDGKNYIESNRINIINKAFIEEAEMSSNMPYDIEENIRRIEIIQNELKVEQVNFQEDIKAAKLELEEIKKEVISANEELRKNKEDVLNAKNELNETKSNITDIQDNIKSFYGRLGEILALIITGIAMIVFNIKVMETSPIDFTSPRSAFLNILAIDLPFIILIFLGISMFHFIIGKNNDSEKNIKELVLIFIKRGFPMLFIIVLGAFILIA